jgi:KUP system potassium uptake protein
MSNAASTADAHQESHTPSTRTLGDLAKLSLGALGVVYGDIGTSPLYAVKECFGKEHGLAVTAENVLGILSLILWALILVVVLKYLTFVMRADNRGEGGILALFALIQPRNETPRRARFVLLMLALFGAALLYGDGMITPAISVLGAVEGLSEAATAFHPYVVPITILILVSLFFVQQKGTGKVGAIFGPAMLVWFAAIFFTGVRAVAAHPSVLAAMNPTHAIHFLVHHGLHGFLVLGSVVLAITGGEALYADMGHFGRRPIRIAWFAVAMPALVANYFGQGAVLLTEGAQAATSPFYALTPGWQIYPMTVIATLAAVIASQALISGAFSLTQQAVQLGYWPRVRIVHTSGEAAGQIYIPEINWMLMVACLALVLGFRSSSGLAAAYGIAVTGTMSITSVLFFVVARRKWGWSLWSAGALVTLFLVVDLAFLAANANKIEHGGWFPLVIGAVIFAMMTTWRRGRAELAKWLSSATMPIDLFLTDVAQSKPQRVRGTAVFMTSLPTGVPPVLLHHLKHNKVLHDAVILLSVITENIPIVGGRDRLEIEALGEGFWRITARYGFMERPNVMKMLRRAQLAGVPVDPATASFYLGRETLLTSGKSPMARWRKYLFAFLTRNARTATSYFSLPPNRVVELGTQVEL